MSAKYRSGLERAFHRQHPTLSFEARRVPYVVTHHYLPDFTLGDVLVETKGLWTGADRSKHRHLRRQRPDLKVLLVFENSARRLSKRSKVSYAEWCKKEGLSCLGLAEALKLSTEDLIAWVNVQYSPKNAG